MQDNSRIWFLLFKQTFILKGESSTFAKNLQIITFTVDNIYQKYFTEVYLDEKMRTNFKIGLDHRCEIFQNLEGDYNNMDLIYEGFKFIAFSSPVITGNNFSP